MTFRAWARSMVSILGTTAMVMASAAYLPAGAIPAVDEAYETFVGVDEPSAMVVQQLSTTLSAEGITLGAPSLFGSSDRTQPAVTPELAGAPSQRWVEMPHAELDMNPQVLDRLVEFAQVDGKRVRQINAYSPSMDRTIPLVWIRPEDTSKPHPVAYFLNGIDGGTGDGHWLGKTDIVNFYANKNVHVIVPMQGAVSYYADWLEPNPFYGGKKEMWETFLVHELVEPLEKAIGGNGMRSLAGNSMGAAAVYNIAAHHPGFYNSIGAFSGCAESNSLWGRMVMSATLSAHGIAPQTVFGPVDSAYARYNDALLNAEKYRQQPNIWIGTASGLPSQNDLEWMRTGEISSNPVEVLSGGSIEMATNYCTHRMKAKLEALNIPATYDVHNTGIHEWSLWAQQLDSYWQVQRKGFGL
ncbi:surface layer protein [Corynebacterium kutscheri]|uniref:Putative esterase n=1 Tax=Corynebacterium kutscheri TaxID=35755 RepID=A0A0F6R353_9CORY|nr:alpha/beta hydrolase family protein [Corynebacterium kutscheri]AKE42048.1 putative esterase [Corynebacterium kutscheri]VEH06093.1 surface layer protein [Corynebacterium kutscheri]VEH10389.1 surface layer protein [Corynebacterium kutscheri]VEH82007.1 surface layer protein [Corynebacterium kutscheri]